MQPSVVPGRVSDFHTPANMYGLQRLTFLLFSKLISLPWKANSRRPSESVPLGRLGGTAVKRLPSAQGVIPALWDRAPHQAPPL